MKKKNIFLKIALVGLLGMFTACADWLDVKPKVAVNEEDLFNRELGFKEALTGIYIQMGDVNLYGREMTYGFIDALAQRYRIASGDYTSAMLYTFPSTLTENYMNVIWKNSYTVIANINNFLEWMDKKREVITTPGYYELMKGEALGLRAFLYFDLLRLWGPVYAHKPEQLSIPYRSHFNREDKALSPANVVLDSIINNLKQAEQLLKDDPMNIEFPVDAYSQQEDVDDFLRYRFKRMNKYAVKAVLARAYLWKGDAASKALAASYAMEVVEALKGNQDRCFKLVTDNSTDRIFSTEIIFSLSLNKFKDRVDTDFSLYSGSKYHAIDKQFIYDMYDVQQDGYNDMRIREGQGFSFSNTGAYSRKFDQSGLYSFAIENTIPLIRLPEMYYILAECTDNLGLSAVYLSQVRSARGGDEFVAFTGNEERMQQIEKEYRKEFYAEGQLWYFYKRNASPKIFRHPVPFDFTDVNYCFSIPEDEEILGILK